MVDRHKAVQEARHSTALEGGTCSPEARALQDRWADGELTTEQLIQETLRLCTKVQIETLE